MTSSPTLPTGAVASLDEETTRFMRPEEPTVTTMALPSPARRSTGHTGELRELRAVIAARVDRVHRLESGSGVGARAVTAPRPAMPVPPRTGPPPVPRPPARPPAPQPTRAPASSGVEAGYAAALAGVLGVASVSTTANFFDELGADSMIMARFCAAVRSRPDLPNVAMKDVYRSPTIAALTGTATGANRVPVRCEIDPVTVRLRLPGPRGPVVEADPRPAPVGTASYLLCGFLQLLVLLGYPALIAFAFAAGAEWVLTSAGPLEIYGRSVAVTGGLFLGTTLLPVAVKWLLVGRWRPTQFPVWSLRYFRFWLVKSLIRTNPMVRFVGTPLYPVYLRLLGARIGRGTTILSPTVPVCTDLLTIGAGTIVRKASAFTGYQAHDGQIRTGTVSIGSGALVGEATVLDIFTSVGDGAQLGHTSSLHAGQSVPAGQRWHGSPAERTAVDYRAVPTAPGGRLRRAVYTLVQLVVLLGVVLPLGMGGVALLVREVPQVRPLLASWTAAADHLPLLLDVLVLSGIVFFGGLLLGLLVITTVPRVLALLVRPDRVLPMYGIAYWALRTITRMTNSTFATRVTGDSSYIVGYLKAIGYRFDRVEQTGSNFGTAVAHDSPFLCHVGSGTVVADGLTFVNADYSSNAFAVSPVRIGARSFLGNGIFYPARARVGDNCLLATKVGVPIDGPVRRGVGLLGSPSFEIPRSTDRDDRLALHPEQRRLGVAAKNRHNLGSIALLLLSRWVYVTLAILLARVALELHPQFGAGTIAALGIAELLLTFGYFVGLDALVRRLVALRPQGVSIYDHGFWRHERYWKVAADRYIQRLNGTPFKAGLWRALGVRVGRRLFDDGAAMTERSFVTIGDHCTLNERSLVQCHSQENDAFKSDRVVIGSGVTVGVGGFVHYGTRLGDGSVIEADSFLMKGEETPPYTRWGGNPAAELGWLPRPVTALRGKS